MQVADQVGEPRSDGLAADEFSRWVSPHIASMARLAARLAPVGDRDDVVQESLSRAWVKRSQFDPRRGTAAAWLLAITADQSRRAHRRRHLLPLPTATPQLRPVDAHVDVEGAVAKLSPRQRLAVNCHYFADLTIMETAAVMHCSQGTVKSTLFDARQQMRRLLEAERGRD